MLRGHSTPSDVPVGQRTVRCQGARGPCVGRLLLPLPTFTRQRARGYCQVRGYTSAQGRPHVWHRQLPAPVYEYTRNVVSGAQAAPRGSVLTWPGRNSETRVKPVTVRVTLFVWSGHERRSRIPPLYCLRIGLGKPIWIHVKLFATNASTWECFTVFMFCC